MCDSTPEDGNNHFPPTPVKKALTVCIKCRIEPPTVQVRNITYCQPCFLDSCIHRFRSQFIKLKVLDAPKVLVAVSGGPASRLLLELFADFCRVVQPRKPAMFPQVAICCVDQSAITGFTDVTEHVRGLAALYDLPYIPAKLAANPSLNAEIKTGKHLSSLEDLVHISTTGCLFQTARENGYNVVVFGDTATTMAIKVMANTAKGRGITLANDIAFSYIRPDGMRSNHPLLKKPCVLSSSETYHVLSQQGCKNSTTVFSESDLQPFLSNDSRPLLTVIPTNSPSPTGIQVIHPLRETLVKEVSLFLQFRSLTSFTTYNLTTKLEAGASIDRLCAAFITGLQNDFPSTVSTIVRTAYKIPSRWRPGENCCTLCEGPIDLPSGFSKIDSRVVHNEDEETGLGEDGSSGLCYACKNIAREVPSALIL